MFIGNEIKPLRLRSCQLSMIRKKTAKNTRKVGADFLKTRQRTKKQKKMVNLPHTERVALRNKEAENALTISIFPNAIFACSGNCSLLGRGAYLLRLSK